MDVQASKGLNRSVSFHQEVKVIPGNFNDAVDFSKRNPANLPQRPVLRAVQDVDHPSPLALPRLMISQLADGPTTKNLKILERPGTPLKERSLAAIKNGRERQ